MVDEANHKPLIEKNVPLIIIGVQIGIFTGWDDVDFMCLKHYGFIPNKIGQLIFPSWDANKYDTLYIDFVKGEAQFSHSEREETVNIKPIWEELFTPF